MRPKVLFIFAIQTINNTDPTNNQTLSGGTRYWQDAQVNINSTGTLTLNSTGAKEFAGNANFNIKGNITLTNGGGATYTSDKEVFTLSGTTAQTFNNRVQTPNAIVVTNTSANVTFDNTASGVNTIGSIVAAFPGTDLRFANGETFNITNFFVSSVGASSTIDTNTGAGTFNLNATNHIVSNVQCNRSNAGGFPQIRASNSTLNACTNWIVPNTRYLTTSGAWNYSR